MQKLLPKIGFALGGGAAKALVQYGILNKLYQEKLRPSIIMGSSMGGIVGAMFASGIDRSMLEKKVFTFFEKYKINDLANLNIFNESLFKKTYSEQLLQDLFGDMYFEDCQTPFAVTAVDLESGELVVIDKGPLKKGLLASAAIPGVFNPVFHQNRYLVDGGLLEDSPIAALRNSGKCEYVIGSRILDYATRQAISGMIFQKFYSEKKRGIVAETIDRLTVDTKLMFQIVYRSVAIVRDELFKYKMEEAKPDLFLEIEMSDTEAFGFKDIGPIIEKGERIMEEHLPELKEIIS